MSLQVTHYYFSSVVALFAPRADPVPSPTTRLVSNCSLFAFIFFGFFPFFNLPLPRCTPVLPAPGSTSTREAGGNTKSRGSTAGAAGESHGGGGLAFTGMRAGMRAGMGAGMQAGARPPCVAPMSHHALPPLLLGALRSLRAMREAGVTPFRQRGRRVPGCCLHPGHSRSAEPNPPGTAGRGGKRILHYPAPAVSEAAGPAVH